MSEAGVSFDIKKENANINEDSAMGAMLKIGSESAKKYNLDNLMSKDIADAHINGDIHIHDLDFYELTTTCCQIDIGKLFRTGFNTGYGFIRQPKEIRSYAALACIAIQSNQNDQHGGQSIPAFDFYMAEGVERSFIKELERVLEVRYGKGKFEGLGGIVGVLGFGKGNVLSEYGKLFIGDFLKCSGGLGDSDVLEVLSLVEGYTDRSVYQAMEALLFNLNSMSSRAGGQVPFSTINYGTDTSEAGRMVIKNILLATEAGLGLGETPIFPIQVFKMKKGINMDKEDPNYDLFKLACKVSAKRLVPNFSNLDATFNRKFYKEGRVETEVAYMGCRTRVISNVYDPNNEVVTGRGNLSFTTINLPRLALLSGGGNVKDFFELLDSRLEMIERQLLERFDIQRKRKPKNYPFLIMQGVWTGSDNIEENDDITELLKQGTLSIGYIGLAEALKYLLGSHHGESGDAQELGLQIVRRIRQFTDDTSYKHKMNFTTLATPAEGLAGRFTKIDRGIFGIVDGVTDKDYYTNSFHIPVSHKISMFKKIKLEAPYHELSNAGHITYVEMEGDPNLNLEAFESIIKFMHSNNIGYGAINHAVDRDPVCGYVGVIGEVCPGCGRRETDLI